MFAREIVEIVSPLSRDECCVRVSARINSPWAVIGFRKVVGRVSESRMSLRKRIWYSNPYQTVLTACFDEEGLGTRVTCRFGLSRFTAAWMTIWFAGVLFIGGAMFLATAYEFIAKPQALQPNAWMGLAIPAAMLAFGFALDRFSRFLARNERDFLLRFVVEAVDGRLDPIGRNQSSSLPRAKHGGG